MTTENSSCLWIRHNEIHRDGSSQCWGTVQSLRTAGGGHWDGTAGRDEGRKKKGDTLQGCFFAWRRQEKTQGGGVKFCVYFYTCTNIFANTKKLQKWTVINSKKISKVQSCSAVQKIFQTYFFATSLSRSLGPSASLFSEETVASESEGNLKLKFKEFHSGSAVDTTFILYIYIHTHTCGVFIDPLIL